MTLDATRGHVSVEIFGKSQAEHDRADRYVGREQHLSIIQLSDGCFYLRAHDEYTKGGRPLKLEVPGPPAVVYSGIPEDIPDVVDTGVRRVQADLDLSGGDFDASNLAISGLADAAIVRLRKIDRTANKILFTDETGVQYSYANRYSEYITLYWDALSGLFMPI